MTRLANLFDRFPWIRCSIAVGPGWHDLAAETLEVIALLAQEDDTQIFVDGIYEKHGRFRLRVSSENEKVQTRLDLIENEAEARSLTICEVCGASGKPLGITVRCDIHAK